MQTPFSAFVLQKALRCLKATSFTGHRLSLINSCGSEKTLRLSRMHALLVKDNFGDIELFTAAFDKLGTRMNLKVASHNENIPDGFTEPNENLSGGLPKIIFLDVNLPDISGLDILEKIHASQHLRFIPVVILTSSSNPKDVSRAYKLGARGYIIKPMDFDHLREKVHATLDFWLKTCTIPH